MDNTGIFVAHFLGLVLELLFYGTYCVVFAGSVWVLVKRRRAAESQPVSPIIGICSWFIFVLLTVHCACTIAFRYKGLVTLGSQPLAALLYLSDSSSVLSLVRASAYALSAAFIDVILIYRLWIVWGRGWPVIVVPVAAILFNCAAFIFALHLFALGPDLPKSDDRAAVWTGVMYALEAFTNVYCAVLIAMRIIRDSMITPASLGKGMQPILWIIVESAAVYTILTLVIMGGILARLPMVIVLLDIVPPIAGITSCLLIVRVGLDMAAETVSGTRSPSRGMAVGPRSSPGESFALKVSVTRHALVSGDRDMKTANDDMDKAESMTPLPRSPRRAMFAA